MYRNRLIAGIALGLVMSVAALGDAKAIKQSKLPPAVLKTAEQHTTGATVTGYTSEKVDGAMVYTMDLVASGLTRGIVMDSEGNVLSTAAGSRVERCAGQHPEGLHECLHQGQARRRQHGDHGRQDRGLRGRCRRQGRAPSRARQAQRGSPLAGAGRGSGRLEVTQLSIGGGGSKGPPLFF